MPDKRQKVLKHLPYEIIFQILIRLPVKSLLQFQLVCKLWFSMITSDRAFIRAHLHHVKHRNDPSFRRHLIVSNSNMFSYGLLNLDKRSYDPIPLIRNYKNVDIKASYDGLVLFSENDQYYLGNPSTRLYKPFKRQYVFKDQCETYGLGYDEASEAYKVVRILRFATHKNFMMHQRAIGAHEYDATSIKVYNCRTDSWKRIGDPFPYNIYTNAQAVVVNGAPHWMVFRNDAKEGTMRDYVIIYFDLHEEKFKEVGAPGWLVHRSSFDLCDFNKHLCLVKYGLYTIEIWVMKQYGVATSWTRLFTLKRHSSRGAVPLSYRGDAKILMLIQRNSLGIVDLNNPTIEASDVECVTFDGECTMTTYVETLVSPYTGRDQAVR